MSFRIPKPHHKTMKKVVSITIAVLALFMSSIAQESKAPIFQYKSGAGLTTPDSSFSINVRFRIQNRAGFTLSQNALGTDSLSDWTLTGTEFRVRRVRLRLDGFVFNPKWTYNLQLSFSRGDMDWDNSGVPNVLRDAMIHYKPNKHWTFSFGQGKLPGNRQRVVSSGELQFADRSIVNANLTIDRDFGFMSTYHVNIGKSSLLIKGAITGGEGRNEGTEGVSSKKATPGLCYTGRVEFLPFGDFTNKGDYSEADLQREQKPKISLAAGYSSNDLTNRTGGQLGKTLYGAKTIETLIMDGVFKFKGLSVYGEYMKRSTPSSPLSMSGTDVRYVYTGEGILFQSGYVFKNNFEIAGRFAQLNPFNEVREIEHRKKNYAVCFSKYIKGHRFKIQTDITLEENFDAVTNEFVNRTIQPRFQIEMGI